MWDGKGLMTGNLQKHNLLRFSSLIPLDYPEQSEESRFCSWLAKPRFLVPFAPRNDNDGLCPRDDIRVPSLYAIFLNTSAEFFDPNPTQLQMACSI